MANEHPMQQPATAKYSTVVELRQYTLYPGQRDTLIELFEREFIETQEAVGIQLIGLFRDIDRADVFVWLRGFHDMSTRATALAAFYGGPAWAAHRDAANKTMLDSDNVYMLRHTSVASTKPIVAAEPSNVGLGIFIVTIYTLKAPANQGFTETFEHVIIPELIASGASPLAVFETEPSANNFPRLPVREGEQTFVWIAKFPNMESYYQHVEVLETSNNWRETVRPALEYHLSVPADILRLTPTTRSQMQ